jgi:hypothetical protein
VGRRGARIVRGAVPEYKVEGVGRKVVERAKEMREVDCSSTCRTAGASTPQRCDSREEPVDGGERRGWRLKGMLYLGRRKGVQRCTNRPGVLHA